MTYLLHFDSKGFFFSSRGQAAIKGDIISLRHDEFDSPPSPPRPPTSLVAHSKQTQQAFALAYWRPVGVGPPAQNENVHSLIPRKDVLHPVTFSSSTALLPQPCFHPLLPR